MSNQSIYNAANTSNTTYSIDEIKQTFEKAKAIMDKLKKDIPDIYLMTINTKRELDKIIPSTSLHHTCLGHCTISIFDGIPFKVYATAAEVEIMAKKYIMSGKNVQIIEGEKDVK